MKQLLMLIVSVPLIIATACKNKAEKDIVIDKRYRHNIEDLRTSFDLVGDTDRSILFKDFGLDQKTYEELVSIYGVPVQEYTDTFEHGLNYIALEEIDQSQIWHDQNWYYNFPDTFKTISNLITHKAIWPMEKRKRMVIYFDFDEDGKKRPFWGNIKEYTPFNIPLWSLDEKDQTLGQVIETRGYPQKQEVFKIEHGELYRHDLESIFALKDTPESLVHMYEWAEDSDRVLRLYYLDTKDINSTKPIWGILIYEMGLYLE